MNITRYEQWNDDADKALRPVTSFDHERIKNEVNSGISELYSVDASWLVTRINGDELVVLCYIGENVSAVADLVFSHAARIGLKLVRFHTQRPALNKLLSSWGFKNTGLYYIFEMEL